MSVSSGLFSHYEEEFCVRAAGLQDAISSGETSLSVIETEIRTCSALLEQLEVEALSAGASERQGALATTRRLRDQFADLQGQISLLRERKKLGEKDVCIEVFADPTRNVPDSVTSGKNGIHGEEIDDGRNNPHVRLLEEYEHVQRTSVHLERTQRLAAEAEMVGASVLGDLRRQREQLERANRNLRETEADIDQSNDLLQSMIRRVFASRLISLAIIALLTISVLFVLYYKFFA
jgi:hypothetical protein